MIQDSPLVSCIMPTKDRRAFAARAIEWFLRQDYPNRELVIVDDGRVRINDLARIDDRIRYVPLDRRLSLGAKRNLACEHAGGTLVAHWDDDDWHAPDRLSRQVAVLLDAGADLCGTNRLPFYDVARHQAFEYVYPASPKRWLAGGTLLYRREWWRGHPFPALNVGEDGAFVAAARGARIALVPDPPFYVAAIHPGNTSPKQTAGSAWRPYPEQRLRALLADDWSTLSGETPATAASEPGPEPSRPHRRVVSDRITVSIPAYGGRPYLLKAVESILAQTHTNLRLIVVNDADPEPPWDLLEHIDDPRLVRFDLATNRGRYFADAVVLEATPDAWFMVQDADDWSDPDRAAALLDACRRGSAVGAVSAGTIRDQSGSEESAQPGDNFPDRDRPLDESNAHRLNVVGVFPTEALRSIGGNYGGERIGYDTIIGNFLLMTGSIAYVDRPLYHRRIRGDSLSNSPETGLRSEERARVWGRLYEHYRPAYEAYVAQQAGRIDREELGRRLRGIRDSHVTPVEREALAIEAARLRRVLARQDERWTAEPAAFEPRPMTLPGPWTLDRAHGVPLDRRLLWNAWTVTPALAAAIAERLAVVQPQRILEIGSGNSTAILAAYAAATGASVTTLEHDVTYRDATARLLTDLGLRDRVDLRLAPITEQRAPDGGVVPWYGLDLAGTFDFVFADGPPQRIGREGILFAIAPHLATDWELWLDDGHRPHELACLERWRPHVAFEGDLYDVDWKGVWVLHPPARKRPPIALPAVAKVRLPVAIPKRATRLTARAKRQASTPLVSALMPTYDRRHFVRRALALFKRQTYPHLELVVVDDGTDPVGDLVADDPRVRYLRLDRRRTIGAKRNAACDAAQGEILIGWDDDDWYAPDRIARQVAPIVDGSADAVGLGASLMLDLVADRYWRHTSILSDRMFEGGIASGTLAFQRQSWVDGTRFPDASLAEDAAFQRALVRSGARVIRLAEDELFVYVRHGSNSWRFTPGSYVDRSAWRSVAAPLFLGAEDLAGFRELRLALARTRAVGPVAPHR